MSLFRSLVAALAQRAARQGIVSREAIERAPEAFSGPITGQKVIPTGSGLHGLAGASGADDPEAVIREFLALPISEQLRIIETEMRGLSGEQQKAALDLLGREMSRKWLPLPGPQTAALTSGADVTLYGGAGGGGKSDWLLGTAITEHRRSLIMRRHFTDLAFLTERAIEINGTRTGFASTPQPVLRTSDGRLVEFGAAQHAGDEQKYQGRPHDFLGLDEAAQFLESQVRFLMGWVRSTDEGQRTRIGLATNPPLSDEGQWLVKMFAPWLDPHHPNPAKAGELRYVVTDENGADRWVDGVGPHMVGGREVKALSRTFIPAKLSDNPYLARTEYASKLDALPEPLRSAVRDGNFMAVRADDAFQVIPSEWVRLAQARWTERPPETQAMTCIAVDSAGGGSDAAPIAHRYGEWFGPIDVVKGPETADGRYMGARVLMLRRNNCQVVVDIGGGYGSEIVTTLKDNEAPVVGFKGAFESAAVSNGSGLKFANKRAEVWWRFREALDPAGSHRIALPPDQELSADLCTPRLDAKAMQGRGVIKVELKEEIRERLGRSPDKGDAVVMCWAYGGLLEYERKQSGGGRRFVNGPHKQAKANVGYEKSKRMYRRYG